MGASRPQPSRPLANCGRHALFLFVLLGGVLLRVATLLGFPPAFLVRESAYYLAYIDTPGSGSGRPAGYAVLELTPLSWLSDGLMLVTSVQHLLGLVTGVLIYVLLLRWGVWRWLAAVATMPVLLDPYELANEHLILPGTLFVFLMCVGVVVLCWHARPGWARLLSGGVLFGAATTVSPFGWALVVVAIVASLLVATSWRRKVTGALTAAIGFGLPLAAYEWWRNHLTGSLGQSRGPAVDVESWQFHGYVPPVTSPRLERLYGLHGSEQLSVGQPAANALVSYQSHVHTPWLLLAIALLLGLAAALGLGRAAASGMRSACLLTALAPGAVVLAAATAGLSWRDQLPGLVLLPAAGALAVTALMRGRRGPAAGRAQIDDVDRAAMAAFAETYGSPELAPVVVVIAAYNEAVGLPRVLAALPQTVCGLPADVLVVDDGSSDTTAAAARTLGQAYLVACRTNRGQGAAMRLGYRVAREHGARYILTTDADAQYDTADFPVVLAPLLDGSADFVTGSRRLGHQHSNDRFRRAGVYVFAWTVSALTGQRLTDTSFGLRAMRAEVTAAVTLNQPQYHSSELLLGTHSHGYRIAEVPGTMHLRAAGSTKKGGNLVYGSRYARVVLGTWWREGCPRPVGETAPALRERR